MDTRFREPHEYSGLVGPVTGDYVLARVSMVKNTLRTPEQSREVKTMQMLESQSSIRVMLIDDYQLLRSGLERLIEEEAGMHVVAQADCVEEALLQLETTPVDIIVIHLKQTGLSGIEMTQRLVINHPEARVIVMIPLGLGVLPSRMMRAGACAYITPCVPPEEMLWTIHLVQSGQRYISPRIAAKLEKVSLTENRTSPFDLLSERELQVALMLIDSQKVTLISEKLRLSRKTVYSYRYRIFDKLALSSDVELTILAVKHGLSDASSLVELS